MSEDIGTREEHLAWCKERALGELAYYPDEQKAIGAALCSLVSDFDKHSETRRHPAGELGMRQFLAGLIRDRDDMLKFIEGCE